MDQPAPTDETPKRVEVVLAHAIEFKPGKKYLIVIDNAALSKSETADVLAALKDMGVDAATAIVTDGDPLTSVQVIEVG